KLLLFRRTSL
ncbi:hypothetical protein AVEN_132784-1, partial [Araneus ventricosus]